MESVKPKKNAYKIATYVLAGVVVLLLVIGYLYLKANIVIVDKQDYEALETQEQLKKQPQGKI